MAARPGCGLLALLWLLLAATPARAAPQHLGAVSVEFAPTTTALGARNLLLYVEPPNLPHWSFSGIVFASDFPAWLDGMLSYRNRGQDFDLSVRWSPGMTVDYFQRRERIGWHAGLLMFMWRYEVK